jgi:hypothetical protein
MVFKQYCRLDYNNIISAYKQNKYDTKNKHLGLPLTWNNCVRRKGIPFVFVNNFSLENLTTLLLLNVAEIIIKYANIFDLEIIEKLHNDNIININAWNEWNEQAVLEPNNVTGYMNLHRINDIYNNL